MATVVRSDRLTRRATAHARESPRLAAPHSVKKEEDADPEPPPEKPRLDRTQRTAESRVKFPQGPKGQPVPDHLTSGVDILFCGINPGIASAARRHHYAHPTNHFYAALYGAGLTKEFLRPDDDYTFPTLSPYRLGLTNLVHKTTQKSEHLKRSDYEDGVPLLLAKVAFFRPKVVCFIGKGISDVFVRVVGAQYPGLHAHPCRVGIDAGVLGFWATRGDPSHGFPRADCGYGILPVSYEHLDGSVTLFFTAPSSSGRVTQHQLPGKTRIMRHLLPLLEAPRTVWEVSIPCIREDAKFQEIGKSLARAEAEGFPDATSGDVLLWRGGTDEAKWGGDGEAAEDRACDAAPQCPPAGFWRPGE
ncbi:thymine-DNA glycosylase [Malassezia sp. CBS 17886]|nr:thymine-DNA glycosylase [Malassezia sp. CBS 17886]